MNKYDVTIIGSGLGGLLCGYILAREGFSVCILEKHHQPGGNLQTFTRHGYRFETGVHYTGALGHGQTLHRYWRYFGLTEVLELQHLDRDCFDKIAYGNHEFPMAQGSENFIEQLVPFFPGDRPMLTAYIARIAEVVAAFPLYNLELPTDHREHHYTTQGAYEFLRNFDTNVPPANQQGPRHRIPLSAVLAGNNYLYGGSRLAPLHVASLINHSFISGAYRIIGGSDLVTHALADGIRMQGGVILTRQEVTSIEQLREKFSVGTSGGEHYISSMVISDIHPATTLSMMPGDMVRPAYQKRIASLENTVSSFILYLAMKPGAFPYLNYNYYYHHSTDPWRECGLSGSQWPGMYLMTTTRPDHQQEFAETVTLLTYMRYGEVESWKDTSTGKRGASYLDFKNERAGKLLELASRRFPELAGAISHMEISTPLTYRDYTGIPEGSLYGIRKNYHEPMLTTVMPKTKIPNFYFTGQNTNMHGLLGVTIGAVVTCGEILGLEYLMKKIKHG